jgi:hypothetical protein
MENNFFRTLEIDNKGTKWVEITHSDLQFPEMIYGIGVDGRVHDCYLEEVVDPVEAEFILSIFNECEEVI